MNTYIIDNAFNTVLNYIKKIISFTQLSFYI